MIDPLKIALFIPPGLRKFKHDLFERIGKKIGRVVRDDPNLLRFLPDGVIPVVGCTPFLKPLIDEWRKTGREFVYWDRGYARRVFATWLPRGDKGGFYRWHRNAFQLKALRCVPDDRWRALDVHVSPWRRGGRNVVIAFSPPNYLGVHGAEQWQDEIVAKVKAVTDRPIVTRTKESKIDLRNDLADAHILVAHGSIAAVEAVILGCPVCVHESSAAALVGLTNISKIEKPVYPDRQQWLNSLAYSQYNEEELVNGTLWRLIN